MMTEIADHEIRALAALVAALRPGWDPAGTRAALNQTRTRGTPWDIAHAALYAAEDRTNRTPAVIPLAGPHWTRGKQLGQTSTGSPIPADIPGKDRCPDHPWERATNCRAHASEAKAATDRDLATRESLIHQGVPRDRVRAILAAAQTPTTPDARTRAGGTR